LAAFFDPSRLRRIAEKPCADDSEPDLTPIQEVPRALTSLAHLEETENALFQITAGGL
jgi:hypothetical protein